MKLKVERKSQSTGTSTSPSHSVLLSKALARFRSEIQHQEDCLLDVDTAEELLQQTKHLKILASRGRSSRRLEPIFSQINDFAEVIAVCGGTDPKATALIWGSLRVILTMASPMGKILDKILDMLDELSLSLPRFRTYEETLPVTVVLEAALVDVYVEVTCFCARVINFLRGNKGQFLRSLWPRLDDDFKQTIRRLRTLSRKVDHEAEAIRLKGDHERNSELIAAMKLLKVDNSETNMLPCYYVPFGTNEQFYGRKDDLLQVRQALDPETTGPTKSKSLVLHGLGGVGKTKVALEYVNSSRDKFDAIFWLSAENSIKLTQDYLEVSKCLGLSPESEEAQDAVAAVSRVREWLGQTTCRWLLVFDNADEAEVLTNAWPGSAAGSILITSRDFTIAFGTVPKSLHIQPFDIEQGVTTFLHLVNRDPSSPADRASAVKIVEALGGLPLAINQISGFIVQQRLKLDTFLPLYERNAAKIDGRKLARGGSEHTLSTVWQLSLSKLSGPSSMLQKLLCFFDPDRIHESVLLYSGEKLKGEDFEFLLDGMDFIDAKEELLKSALIERSDEEETLSIHRLVQAAVMKMLSTEEKLKLFNTTIAILSNGFPNTWNVVTAHQFTAWSQCERCLLHVNFLIRQSTKYKIQLIDPKAFAELILRCCWYLYEREHYEQARQFMQIALRILGDSEQGTLFFASATMLQGLIDLDTCNLQSALDCFLLTLKIREKVLDPDDAFIASSLNAISIAYTELGDTIKAVETQQKAIIIRLRTNSDRIGNSYSNMASTYLRMGRPDAAEKMLMSCPSLLNFTDDTFLKSGNPRFSGDMVLLARIRQQQGRLDDALRLSSKALAFRQTLLGNRLKTCDSLYQVAGCLQQRGDVDSALNLLEESVSIGESMSFAEAGRYQARAHFKLSQLYEILGNVVKSKECRTTAAIMREKITGQPADESVPESEYNKLVLWMLW